MNNVNEDVRRASDKSQVPLWKVADKLGISESTMTRKMRHELSETEKKRILAIIADIAAKR